jgi:hypothetical protein
LRAKSFQPQGWAAFEKHSIRRHYDKAFEMRYFSVADNWEDKNEQG